MTTTVVFVQGGGAGARDADRALAASLRRELGAGYEVSFPRMPDGGDPDYATWKPRIAAEIARVAGDLVLVGHSAGAYMLVRYLSEEVTPKRPIGIFLIATPYPGADEQWEIPGFSLPLDFGARLPQDAVIFLYHSPDDRAVPSAHLRLYARAIPRATVRETTGGHQLDNDLSLVAADIRDLRETSRG